MFCGCPKIHIAEIRDRLCGVVRGLDNLLNSDRDVYAGNGVRLHHGYIHILLVLAVVAVAIQLINGRRLT
jgi:hypothetical protein